MSVWLAWGPRAWLTRAVFESWHQPLGLFLKQHTDSSFWGVQSSASRVVDDTGDVQGWEGPECFHCTGNVPFWEFLPLLEVSRCTGNTLSFWGSDGAVT